MKPEIKIKWQKDLARYPKRPWLKEASILAIYWFRHGQSVDLMADGILKSLQTKIYWFIFHVQEILLGISIPKSVECGAGLRIYHMGNIFIHNKAVIGENCTLRQGITIGNRQNDDDVPVLGNNVDLGAYAQILGNIKIGDNVKIGAMSVVIKDVPDNATAYGVPAKIKPTKQGVN